MTLACSLSADYWGVSIFTLLPWPHLISRLVGGVFCLALDAASAVALWLFFFESVSKVTQLQSVALWHMTDSTAHSSILLSAAPCCRHNGFQNLNRWLHRDRITCSLPAVRRKVDFTSDLWVLLTGVMHINTRRTSFSCIVSVLIPETDTLAEAKVQQNRFKDMHLSGTLI